MREILVEGCRVKEFFYSGRLEEGSKLIGGG